jgi:hypothetical protein
MYQFQIGDIVETIDDVIKGVIESINGEQITIVSDDGFSLDFMAKELVYLK